MERFRLDGQLAFITGGGRGIGLSTAEAFCEAGARVVISDRDPATLETGRQCLADKGMSVDTAVLDVARSDDVTRVAEETASRHGPVDILISNAGIGLPDAASESLPDEDWRKIMDIDLNGVYWTCREFGRQMLAKGSGAIVTTGSMSGIIANRPQRQAAYNTAKAGVHHLTRSLAVEWAERGVRVNSVAPTYVDGPGARSGWDPAFVPVWMDSTPMKRAATPDEIASAILFLSSGAASAMTGTVLLVDCGYTSW